jgi:competence protein ComEA
MLKKLLVGILAIVASIGMALAAVNINTASQSELEALSGIGPAKAKAIIDYRKINGNFKTVEDVKNVKGIGDKIFEKIKPELSVTGASVASSAKATKAEMASAPATGKGGKKK